MLRFIIIYGLVELIYVWVILYANRYEFHMKNDDNEFTND